MTDRGVCVVTHPLSSAGENATRTLLDILAELGPVSLITADLPESSTIRNDHEFVELSHNNAGTSIPRSAAGFLINQIRMCNAIWRQPKDVILFFGATSYILPILFTRAIGKMVLIEPRGDVPLTLRMKWEKRTPEVVAQGLAGLVRGLERAGFVAADRIITYTPNMAREIGIDPEADKVYPHGARYIDIKKFSIDVPFKERDGVVGFVGRIDEEKGIKELAEIAKQLPDDLTFRFIGDGPLYDWLEDELATEIESGKVELVGWVNHNEIPEELNRMKLIVMASQSTEGLPTSILEAFACGTPVFATPVAGIPDVIEEGVNGRLIDSTSGGSIAQIIYSDLNQGRLDEFGKNARKLASEQYSISAAVSRYKELFDSL